MSYKIGYKKPPKNTQFKPGQSGNPKGRPKNDELQIPKKERKKLKKLPEESPFLEQLCERTLAGNKASSRLLAQIVQRQLKATSKENRTKDMLASLVKNADRASLLKQWKELYGTDAPQHISKQFMTNAIAYRIQENAFGGLNPALRKYLKQAAAATNANRPLPVYMPGIPPGTRFLREWHGKTYEVRMLEKGVEFEGKQYRSLTQVACLITGTKWSGPDFFGLKVGRNDKRPY